MQSVPLQEKLVHHLKRINLRLSQPQLVNLAFGVKRWRSVLIVI